MKPAISSCITCLLALMVNVQSYYKIGEHTVTVSADNTTHIYKYTNNDIKIKLQNATNKYIGTPMDYTNGRTMAEADNVLSEAFTPKNSVEETYAAMVALFDKTITETDGEDVRKNINHQVPMFMTLAVSSTTGKIMEAHYRISVGDGFDEVSPKAYYHIEKALKENISFNVTETGKQLNYLPITYLIFLPEKK